MEGVNLLALLHSHSHPLFTGFLFLHTHTPSTPGPHTPHSKKWDDDKKEAPGFNNCSSERIVRLHTRCLVGEELGQ